MFKVKPAPEADGIVHGYGSAAGPFTVVFNMCASADPDGDPLLFAIDFDGDGAFDESGSTGGHCRHEYGYVAGRGDVRDMRPTLCVVDLDAAGLPRRERECKTYSVRVYGEYVRPECALTAADGGTPWVGLNPVDPVCRCPASGAEIGFLFDFVKMCTGLGYRNGAMFGANCVCLP